MTSCEDVFQSIWLPVVASVTSEFVRRPSSILCLWWFDIFDVMEHPVHSLEALHPQAQKGHPDTKDQNEKISWPSWEEEIPEEDYHSVPTPAVTNMFIPYNHSQALNSPNQWKSVLFLYYQHQCPITRAHSDDPDITWTRSSVWSKETESKERVKRKKETKQRKELEPSKPMVPSFYRRTLTLIFSFADGVFPGAARKPWINLAAERSRRLRARGPWRSRELASHRLVRVSACRRSVGAFDNSVVAFDNLIDRMTLAMAWDRRVIADTAAGRLTSAKKAPGLDWPPVVWNNVGPSGTVSTEMKLGDNMTMEGEWDRVLFASYYRCQGVSKRDEHLL
ncbi:hypothetical protein WN48_10649 [Eufriesea mexicana]|uniref:Uncharacterized protein n=1 Tax=Eufriesea mexicana TaxID=516756 RepID=A0A310SI15_9HYME|nr:hypothetical protein WN48_10649 [Eufriesea mexicana]